MFEVFSNTSRITIENLNSTFCSTRAPEMMPAYLNFKQIVLSMLFFIVKSGIADEMYIAAFLIRQRESVVICIDIIVRR